MSMTTPEEELEDLKRKYAEQAKEMEAVRIIAARRSTDAAHLKAEMAVASLMLGVAYDTLMELSGPEPTNIPDFEVGLPFGPKMSHEVKLKWLFTNLEMAMADITKSQKGEAAINMVKYADLMVVVNGMPPIGEVRGFIPKPDNALGERPAGSPLGPQS